jgi:hypothetical protein
MICDGLKQEVMMQLTGHGLLRQCYLGTRSAEDCALLCVLTVREVPAVQARAVRLNSGPHHVLATMLVCTSSGRSPSASQTCPGYAVTGECWWVSTGVCMYQQITITVMFALMADIFINHQL